MACEKDVQIVRLHSDYLPNAPRTGVHLSSQGSKCSGLAAAQNLSDRPFFISLFLNISFFFYYVWRKTIFFCTYRWMLGWRSTRRIWSTASYSTSRPSTASSTWSLTQRRRWISGFAASATSADSTQLMTVRVAVWRSWSHNTHVLTHVMKLGNCNCNRTCTWY